MSPLQKLICDEFEYFRGMLFIFAGMTKFICACIKLGVIDNVLVKEGVER